MLKLRITPKAIEDIVEIKEYIETDSQQAATKFSMQIQEALDKLTKFPNMGVELNAKLSIKTDYLCYVWQKYLIFYKNDEKHVSVYRVLHARRDYIKLLDITKEKE